MSVYYYEPFYNFDRFLESFARPTSATSQQLQALDNTAPVVVRPR